jgi:hypothetical protein
MIHVYTEQEKMHPRDRQRYDRAQVTWKTEPRIKVMDGRNLNGVYYFKDMIARGFELSDSVLYTNADIAFCSDIELPGIHRLDSIGGCVYSHRRDTMKPIVPWTQAQALKLGKPFHGVDLVLMTRDFWSRERDGFPDLLISREGFDWIIKYLGERIEDCIYHEKHMAYWFTHRLTDLGNLQNRARCLEWANKNVGRWPTLFDEWPELNNMKKDPKY